MRKIEVVDYDPSWPAQYEAELNLLHGKLGDIILDVNHIGSTSVRGLAAKPVIDILIEVTSVTVLDEHIADLEAMGYEPKGELGIPGRRYFKKGGDNRSHHIHAFASGDSNLIRYIAFRDYLRTHPEIAQEYAALKRQIVATCNNDIDRYCDGKDAFVKRIETVAIQCGLSTLHCTDASR